MAGATQRIRRFLHPFGLALYLVGLYTGPGCSKTALEKTPDLSRTWICDDGADEAMRLRDHETGILLHQQVLEKDPGNGLAYYHLGYAYGQIGNHLKEAFYYEKAIHLGLKRESIFFNLGMAYGELNQTKESIHAFKKALDINPTSADSHFGLAVAYQTSLAYKLAEKEFLEAIRMDPVHLEARLYLSALYADMGELQKALNQLRKVLEIDPTNKRARELLDRIDRE